MTKKEHPCVWYSLWETPRIKTGLCHHFKNHILDAQISVDDEEHCQMESYCAEYAPKILLL